MSVEERAEKYTEAHIILLILSSQAPQEPPLTPSSSSWEVRAAAGPAEALEPHVLERNRGRNGQGLWKGGERTRGERPVTS